MNLIVVSCAHLFSEYAGQKGQDRENLFDFPLGERVTFETLHLVLKQATREEVRFNPEFYIRLLDTDDGTVYLTKFPEPDGGAVLSKDSGWNASFDLGSPLFLALVRSVPSEQIPLLLALTTPDQLEYHLLKERLEGTEQ